MAKKKETKKQKLAKSLSYLKDGKAIVLGDDTFLCGKELDGSDKVYGFKREGKELMVVTREVSDGYPITAMDRGDLDYMFNLSSVAKNIKKKKYDIVEANDI